MESSIFKFVWRYSKRQQIMLLELDTWPDA